MKKKEKKKKKKRPPPPKKKKKKKTDPDSIQQVDFAWARDPIETQFLVSVQLNARAQ